MITEAAKWLLNETKGDLVYAFYGEMGVGKTTLIKEICKELGAIDIVNSPTFALINEYNTDEDEPMYHFDFYRIERIEEAFDFGYEEYLYSNSYCFIEWPEKIEELLPEKIRKVSIRLNDDDSRTVELN